MDRRMGFVFVVVLLGISLILVCATRGDLTYVDCECFEYGRPQYVIFLGLEQVADGVEPPNQKLFRLEWVPVEDSNYPPCSFMNEQPDPEGWEVWLTLNFHSKYLYLVRDGGYERYFGLCDVNDCPVIWENELQRGPRVISVHGKAYLWVWPDAQGQGPIFDFNYDGIVNFKDWSILTREGEVPMKTVSLFADNWLQVCN
ncbi:hypothetical protein ES703_13512 [subsurface metagenome]